MSIGAIVMVVLLIIALDAYRGRARLDAQPAPAPTLPLPELPPSSAGPAATPPPPALPGLSPRASVLPTTARATPGASAPVVTGQKPTAPPSPTSGRYQVVNSFYGGFIGEVLISNRSQSQRGWTARLAFPGGRVADAWVENSEQGTLSRTDDGFAYRSGVDVAPGASTKLRFHIEHADSRPASCTVDGTACLGL